MRDTSAVRQGFEREKQLLEALYEVLEPGKEERGFSKYVAATLLKTTPAIAERTASRLRAYGLLRSRVGAARQGEPDFPGRVGFWTLVYPKDEGMRRLAERQDELLRQPVVSLPRHAIVPRPVLVNGHAIEPIEPDETVAIEGPDAPNPFEILKPLRRDEAQALVEQARRYSERQDFLRQERERFEQMGITLHPGAVQFDRDERLEHIALVLPYVAAVEKSNESLNGLLEQARAELTTLREAERARRRASEARKDAVSAGVRLPERSN